MKLIIGIGNPGREYDNTRHNAGKMLIGYISEILDFQFSIFKHDADIFKKEDTIYAKSRTFMNSSGIAVNELANYYDLEPEEIYVAHDDLDLPIGQFKIQKGVGPKVHNGINSINIALRTSNYWRIRIGVDNRDPENRVDGEKYVLEKFTQAELGTVKAVFEEIYGQLEK